MARDEAHSVKLRCLNSIGDAIIDQFGKDIMFYADGDNHFIVNLTVELSPPFFAWVATFGKKMTILGDEIAVEKMKKFLENAYKQYKSGED